MATRTTAHGPGVDTRLTLTVRWKSKGVTWTSQGPLDRNVRFGPSFGQACRARIPVKGPGLPVSGGDVDTLAEVDEALTHLAAVPADERGPFWTVYRDKLLEQRYALTQDDGDVGRA